MYAVHLGLLLLALVMMTFGPKLMHHKWLVLQERGPCMATLCMAMVTRMTATGMAPMLLALWEVSTLVWPRMLPSTLVSSSELLFLSSSEFVG